MKTFDWQTAKERDCEQGYGYLLHVHRKNIQEKDFVRGFTTMPHDHVHGGKYRNEKYVIVMYNHLKSEFGFFIKENWQ